MSKTVKDIFTIIKASEYRIANDSKSIAYISKLPTFDDLLYQVSQYKNKRSKKRCRLYGPFILILSLFNRKPTLRAEENLREFALKNGFDIGVGGKADQGVITTCQWNNQTTKNIVVWYEDILLSKTFDLAMSKGLGVQVGIIVNSEFFVQLKAGKIINGKGLKGKIGHITSLFPSKNGYVFVDSDNKGSRGFISKESLQNMISEGSIYAKCRVILPVIKL